MKTLTVVLFRMDSLDEQTILKDLDYPVAKKSQEILSAIQKYSVCGISGEAGSGKSTIVPIIVCANLKGRIIVVQPRRLAAIAVSHRINELCEKRGGRICGFIVRQERDEKSTDRIICMTTGVFLRMISEDPSLTGISAVILDEIHERSLESDLCWVLAKNALDLYRHNLKLIAMSASVGEELFSKAGIQDFGWLSISGRLFPVEIEYRAAGDYARELDFCAEQVEFVCRNRPGDILVFLPGEKEIRRVHEMLNFLEKEGFLIFELFGKMKTMEQKYILEKKNAGRRIILSTNIAQTSLTIEGISCVLDSGLEKSLIKYPGEVSASLMTQRISVSSALQRTGRAGRLGPGFCLRLWDKREKLNTQDTPAIFKEDNSRLVLELCRWGDCRADQYQWLDFPDPVLYQNAIASLQKMHILDHKNNLTEKGKICSSSSLIPAFASCVYDSKTALQKTSILLTALLLEERSAVNNLQDFSLLNPQRSLEELRFKKLAEKEAKYFGFQLDYGPVANFDYSALIRSFYSGIGMKDWDNVYKISGGPSLKLTTCENFPEYLLVFHSDHKTGTGVIYQYLSLESSLLKTVLKEEAEINEELFFDKERKTFTAIRTEAFGSLVLAETRIAVDKMEKFTESFYKLLNKEGPSILAWNENSSLLKERISCLKAADVSETNFIAALRDFYNDSPKSPAQINIEEVLFSMIEPSKRKLIRQLDEKRFRLENGKTARLRYEKDGRIIASARVQDFFGVKNNPIIAGISVTAELLSPAGRPVQVTGDLAGFWKNTYQSVRKDMAGRYPKHNWPENPFVSQE